MLLFGWRIPFLLSIVSASAAVALRLHMPEPEEFTCERNEVIQHNLQRIASQRASSFRQYSRSSSTASAGAFGSAGSFKGLALKTIDSLTLNRQQQQCKLQQQQQQEEEGGLSPQGSGSVGGSFKGIALKAIDSLTLNRQQQQHKKQQGGLSPQGSENTGGDVNYHPQKLYSLSENAAAAAGPADQFAPTNGDASIAIEGAEGVPEKQGEYVPALRLLRQHWGGVLLQFLFEAWVSIGFWVISTWLPVQAMLIVNLTVMGAVQLAAGWASDKGMPRVWSCFAVFTAAAGISVPVFIGFARASAAGCWLLHLLLMVLMGWVLGVVPGGLQM
jgi:hypothetical protein